MRALDLERRTSDRKGQSTDSSDRTRGRPPKRFKDMTGDEYLKWIDSGGGK